MSSSEIVYVRLLEEGIDVWRPVVAMPMSEIGVYRIVGIPGEQVKKDEILEFPVGSAVICEGKLLDGKREKVAVKLYT